MPSSGSVTTWIGQLRAGNRDAAQRLFERYFPRLVGLAGKRLRNLGVSRRARDDEEDVALSAFDSFCRAAEQGRFPRLDDRDDLWALLAVITARKAIDLRDHELRLKNGNGKVGGESVLDLLFGTEDGAAGIDQVVGREPTPEFAALVAEELQRLMASLPDDEFRSIALAKMEGFTIKEIAARLGCSRATVERRLDTTRKICEELRP
jgi:RNA polymerase sigma factor (sigma-70 family)